MRKKILVVGAGLGGLATAIRLAKAGHEVEVWEKNEAPGGKLKELKLNGFTWGTGPSLLTMPEILRDLYEVAGEDIFNHLKLVELPSTCRYFWANGKTIDENAEFWKRPEVAKFLEYAQGIYELSGEAYLNYPPSEFWKAFHYSNWKKLQHLPKIATQRTMAQEIRRRLRDPLLQQIFFRFATYNGSDPYAAPATFNIIPFVQAEFGGWYVKGGMPRISQSLGQIAARLGVTFRFLTMVTKWDGQQATSFTGHRGNFDLLVCNGDVITSQLRFLATFSNEDQRESLLKPALSTSGFILFLGVKGRDERLDHHNIFFSDRYSRECAQIHSEKIAPLEPTIYVSVSSRHDPDHAPADHDNYFVLVNVPARKPEDPWTKEETVRYRNVIINRLEKFGLKDLSQRIVTERAFTPTDFATRDLAHGGSLYGWASHSIRTALFRPPIQNTRIKKTYFVGGTTHPGGGIPLVLLSGKMVADRIIRENK